MSPYRGCPAAVVALALGTALTLGGCAGRDQSSNASPAAARQPSTKGGPSTASGPTRIDLPYSGASARHPSGSLSFLQSDGALYLLAGDGAHRVDPSSGRELGRIAVDAPVGYAGAVLDGRMYLATERPEAGVTAFDVVTVDLATGTTVRTTPIPDDKALQGITVVDHKVAATGQVAQSWKLPGATAFGLVHAAGATYISSEDGNDNYTLLELRPEGTTRAVVALGPTGLLVADGATLWRVASGSLSAVDLRTSTVTRQVPLPDAVIDDVTIVGHVLWIAAHDRGGSVGFLLRYQVG